MAEDDAGVVSLDGAGPRLAATAQPRYASADQRLTAGRLWTATVNGDGADRSDPTNFAFLLALD